MECANCTNFTLEGCDKCKAPYCSEECFDSHPCQQLGKSFDTWSDEYVVRRVRAGGAQGISAFEQLGKEIAHYKIQLRLRKRAPFEETPIRQLLVRLHSQYYEAATWWSQWAGGVERNALFLSRLLEDTIRALLSAEANTLRYMEDPDIQNASRELYEDLPELTVADRLFAQTEARKLNETTVNPRNFRDELRKINLYSDAQIDAIVDKWVKGPLEIVRITAIVMDLVVQQRRRITARALLRELAFDFAAFGEFLFSQGRNNALGEAFTQ
jgi:hypothetical protein